MADKYREGVSLYTPFKFLGLVRDGKWAALQCPRCKAVVQLRSVDLRKRLFIYKEGELWSTMPCMLCFHTFKLPEQLADVIKNRGPNEV